MRVAGHRLDGRSPRLDAHRRAKPVHRRRVGRRDLGDLQPGRQPVRRDGRDRGGRRRRRRHRPGHRRRPAGLRRDRLAMASRRRASRPPHAHRRPPRARPGRDRPRRDPQYRQGASRERVRRRRRHQRLPLLRRARRQGGRPAGRHDRCERAEPHRLRAPRRVRADRSVELPAPADLVEGRAGAGGRGHDDRQAVTGHAADDDPSRQAPRRGRRPEGRRQPRARAGQPRRAGARREPRCRPRVVHGKSRGREVDHGRGCRQREAGRARARWQEPEHRVRRRRLRDRGRQRADRGVPAQRPGLLGRLPADRRGQHPRPVRRGARPPRGPDPAGPRHGRRNRNRAR